MRYAMRILGSRLHRRLQLKSPNSRLVFTLIGLVALLLHGQSESSFRLPVARYTPSLSKEVSRQKLIFPFIFSEVVSWRGLCKGVRPCHRFSTFLLQPSSLRVTLLLLAGFGPADDLKANIGDSTSTVAYTSSPTWYGASVRGLEPWTRTSA